jgi:N-hydroxyarylamine O-acetyltransferase
VAVDLGAYFARIEYTGTRYPSITTLRALQARHPVAIPFANLDVLRGTGVRLDPASVEQKLVGDRRGGYCFEHNLLFATVLRRSASRSRPFPRACAGRSHRRSRRLVPT